MNNNNLAYTSGSLYVGDLHPDVTEAQLFEIFAQLGPVISIRICRDAITRRSLGYAYVNYHNISDAERAIEILNYKEIKGKACRIMWSQRDPNLRKSNVGNIFIKNLHKDIDNKTLYDTFSTFGNILSCKVATDDQGNSKGYGFVHYETLEAAEMAIEKVNGKILNGKQCYVAFFIPKKERSQSEEVKPKWTNIYVKPLEKSWDVDKLMEIFSPFGKITSAYVVKDEKGESKCFGFVNFETHEEAAKAVDTLNEKLYEGKQLFVGKAQKKMERERELKQMFEKIQRERMSKYQGVNLYVKNLDDSIDDEKLRQEFSSCGTIASAKVMTDEKGVSKGFGFVCYSTPEEATKAVTEMNGKMLGNKPIYVALAQRKDQRRAQLEMQHMQNSGRGIQPIYNGALFYPPNARPPFMYSTIPPQPYPFRRFPQGRGTPLAPFQMQPQIQPQMQPQMQPNNMLEVAMNQRNGPSINSKNNNNQKNQKNQKNMNQTMVNYPGIKYNPNVRNQFQPPQPNFILENLPSSPEERKQMIGEHLYPLIEGNLRTTNQDISLAGKITGMILESLEQSEVIELLEDHIALQKKVQEAIQVLERHVSQKEKNTLSTKEEQK